MRLCLKTNKKPNKPEHVHKDHQTVLSGRTQFMGTQMYTRPFMVADQKGNHRVLGRT